MAAFPVPTPPQPDLPRAITLDLPAEGGALTVLDVCALMEAAQYLFKCQESPPSGHDAATLEAWQSRVGERAMALTARFADTPGFIRQYYVACLALDLDVFNPDVLRKFVAQLAIQHEMQHHNVSAFPFAQFAEMLVEDERARLRTPQGPIPPASEQQLPKVADIVLSDGNQDGPTVLGRTMPRLTPGQFRVVKALIDAHPERLSKDVLAVRAKVDGPVNMIDRLRRRDPAWAAVLDKPGKAHGGYGLRV